ncbi:MAG: exosortase/archaeosortase family protein [Dysgonamonadaceae bacterium]|jgi:exosortase/archaeosortase family protein|nr:exosortase/archaeosortase family protein [Dysgonamonadaceae bacterium]
MNDKFKKIILFLEPYKGPLLFLFLLFLFWGLWKITISGDLFDKNFDYYPEHPIGIMYFWGRDITPEWLYTACRWLTESVSWFIHLFPNTENLVTEDYFLYFPGETSNFIIWGCTGIKQMTIFSCIMLCYLGPWKKKLWYIPMGCVILTLYNITRIGLIIMLTSGHANEQDRFDSLHDGIFRYIYYTIIFLLWLCWEELIAKKHREHDSQRKNSASA